MSPNDMRQIAIATLREHRSMSDNDNWSLLTLGGWSLIDQFDSDGRRYVIAERCSLARRVSRPEWRMLVARARGSALKVIAFDLGISVPAASRRIRRAMERLGLRSQSELARLLARGVGCPDVAAGLERDLDGEQARAIA